MIPASDVPATPTPIPVILDTDIGGDIDDTWALGLLLRSPELDLKLALGEFGRGTYRASLLARFLTAAGRTDIPVGVGIEVPGHPSGVEPDTSEATLLGDYQLDSYAGTVHRDGVQALIDLIMASPTPITVICIASPINLAEALRRQPEIARKARFVGMFGSVRLGYAGNKEPCVEANACAFVDCTRAVLGAPWQNTLITPLDTCGLVRLDGEAYRTVHASADPVAREIIGDYRTWSAHPPGWAKGHKDEAATRSTVLFDTVAVYLAFSHAGMKLESLPIAVTDKGMTVIDPSGPTLSVATEWNDPSAIQAFEKLLVERLTRPQS
ncbi:Inosine-uridine nucleoside N-ribohydrolase [Verrucomicrobium sp. GAS474]|uniref:nucleoside hydrolase n=1 Tax=Verrucomicrobium sp. GAS474 TaxID=1882831 RepID=UPI00087B8646|nr:nucleoside hydrolase [Verrucomicrobium sp. GAS474]SDT89452.1 Inosine-uridine nucleoside N-ribohydrolase [Verrucomicrobium sp. GAS474]